MRPEARRLKGKDREKSNRWYKALRKSKKSTDVKRQKELKKEEKMLNKEMSGKSGTEILGMF